MYNQNDFLDKSLEIINNNRIKSNSLKNHFLKNIMNNEYVSHFLGYISELEFDLEALNNYISDFRLLNNNMILNLQESNVKEKNYKNEINRLKEALNKANEEIHNIRNYNKLIYKRNNYDINNKIVPINEEKKNIENKEDKFNYFRNYLSSTPYNTFRKMSKNNRQNNNDINKDYNIRFTYYRNNNDIDDSKENIIDNKNINITTYKKNINKKGIINNSYRNNSIRKNQSLNKTKKIIKNENNNNNYKGSFTKELNNSKTKSLINKNFKNSFDEFKSANNSNYIKLNLNNNNERTPNNEDIKEFINETNLNNTINNQNYNLNSNLNFITNNQKNQNLIGKIITNNKSNAPINQINQINYSQMNHPMIRTNYSSYDFQKNESAIILSKRMQNYIHNQNLKKRFEEISKDNSDIRQNRINNIIEIISHNKDKLNELKLMFGNNIEAQILNRDLSDIYLNKIENILYYMGKGKSIIPFSKRYQIQNHSSKKKNKTFYDEEDNKTKNERFTRKKINDENYNKENIKRWNTTKNFFEKKNINK